LRRDRHAILVVDDDDDFRELLVEHLRASGRRVHAARDGAEALALMLREEDAIGLVLLDLRMPVMDGFDLCRRIERWPVRAVPVVVLTAEHETRGIAGSRSIVAVLHKPLDLRRLDAVVDAHLAA
jgi:DNA-binding response OmpR family regulator